YCTLLGFVNFRLYTSIGLMYPPKFDATGDERGAELAAFTLEGRKVDDDLSAIESSSALEKGNIEPNDSGSNTIQTKVDAILGANGAEVDVELEEPVTELLQEDDDAIDTFDPAAPEADILPQPQRSSGEAAIVFAPFTFF